MKEDFKNVVIQKTSSTNRVAIRQVYGKDVPAIVKKLKAKIIIENVLEFKNTNNLSFTEGGVHIR